MLPQHILRCVCELEQQQFAFVWTEPHSRGEEGTVGTRVTPKPLAPVQHNINLDGVKPP